MRNLILTRMFHRGYFLLLCMLILISCGDQDELENKQDTTPPVITLNGASTITLVQGSSYVEAGASASDDVDGDVNVSIVGTVDTNAPNTYTITYTASDSANNTSTVTRTVIIVISDTTPPVITLNGASTITLEQGTAYVEEGASATDDVDGNVNITITGTVDINTPDTYTITYTATDGANNTSTATRIIIVEALDITPPVITLNGASTITLVQGSDYVEPGASAMDDVDGIVNIMITGTVDINTPDTYTITYTATDRANNTATATRTVIIEETMVLGQATLTWSAPVLNEDESTLDDLAGYKISWGNVTGVYTNEVTILDPGLTSYTVGNLSAGYYVFALQALDTSNNLSLFSNELTKTVE